MSHYGEFLRRLKRATTYHGRRGTTKPKLGQDPPFIRTIRAGPRRRRTDASPLRRFHAIAWPAYFTIPIGVFFHWADGQAWVNMSSKVPFGFFPIVMVPLCLVFAARAFGAVDTARIRYSALVLNLVYPAFLILMLVLA